MTVLEAEDRGMMLLCWSMGHFGGRRQWIRHNGAEVEQSYPGKDALFWEVSDKACGVRYCSA
jgi:hypothetical protein